MQITLHDAGAEVATAAVFEKILQAQRAQIETQRSLGLLRQRGVVLASKISAPIDVHIRIGLVGQAHENQFFFENLLDLQTRPIFGLIHQRGIQNAQLQLAEQVFAVADFHAQGMAGDILANFAGPAEHQRVAQTHLATDVQHIAITFGQRQITPRGFPGLHQLIGVHHERFAIGRQAGAGTIAHEQGAAQLALEFLYPCGDRGLGDMELLGSRGQAAMANDFEEGAGEVDVHGVAGGVSARIVRAPPDLWRGGLPPLGAKRPLKSFR
ncbi:hypothetical protein D3C71_1419550 [compost metagenome]